MVVATDYRIEFDKKLNVYKMKNKEKPCCPDCGLKLFVYDSRRRHSIDGAGFVRWFLLRRLRCPKCKKIHTEMPDFMTAKKHYEKNVIIEALNNSMDNCPADDSTIRRWRQK